MSHRNNQDFILHDTIKHEIWIAQRHTPNVWTLFYFLTGFWKPVVPCDHLINPGGKSPSRDRVLAHEIG